MNISIHALREEGDRSSTTKAPTGTISIHALREEGDLHSPAAMVLDRTISIHALREEGDGDGWRSGLFSCHFYPRPPRGGRPRTSAPYWILWQNFYPRPPRGGRHGQAVQTAERGNFYPRPPRGGRLTSVSSCSSSSGFLSTPSARRATVAPANVLAET